MREFKEAKPSRLVIDFCKFIVPAELRRAQIELCVPSDGIRRFGAVADKHVAIICNHPDQYDPGVMFAFSRLVFEDFAFVAAREVFDNALGAVGWLFQRLGCYSVERGEADHASFHYTRAVLVDGANKLVIFPEGEVTRRPDKILPLRPGTARVLFQAQEDLQRTGSAESILVLPMAIHWRYRHDVTPRVAETLRRIEERVGICSPARDLVKRAYVAGMAMLSGMEIEYFSRDNSELPYEERICRLREHILQQIGNLVDVPMPDDGSHLVWVHRILNAIVQFWREDASCKTTWQRRLHAEQTIKLKQFLNDVHRLQHLAGVDEPPQTMTPERLVAMVRLIEREVLGACTDMGPRTAFVGIGDPIPVLEYARFGERRTAMEGLTSEMSDVMQGLIDELDGARPDTWLFAS